VGDPDLVGDVQRRLIAFDLDGTLIESRRDLADSANDLIVELGGQPLTVEQVAGMVGEGARVLISRALAAAGIDADLGLALPRFLEFYDRRLLNHTRLYDGLLDVVRGARARGARTAVLTNKPLDPTEKILAGLGVRGLFDDVIGGDSEFPRKPDPASLQALMQRAGTTPAETLMVGDTRIDLEAAHRAGVRCCIVSFGFGFRRDLVEGADWIVDDADALGRVIDTVSRPKNSA
jgi:phosphoglycolate phosphatase